MSMLKILNVNYSCEMFSIKIEHVERFTLEFELSNDNDIVNQTWPIISKLGACSLKHLHRLSQSSIIIYPYTKKVAHTSNTYCI